MKNLAMSLALLGLAAGCGDVDSEETVTVEAGSSVVVNLPDDALIETEPVMYNAAQELTVEVPGMHCPFGCYPAVKDTLAAQEGVEAIELVPQKSENEIDDRRIIVKLNGTFDATKAFAALSKAGFDGAKVSAQN